MKARYRKYNDRSLNSSTYHKKDGTAIRSKLNQETKDEVSDFEMEEHLEIMKECPLFQKEERTDVN